MYFLFILILVIILFYIHDNSNCFENFYYPVHQAFNFDPYYNSIIPYYGDYTNFPFWNTQIGQTTNMSYDLRGDPIVIPRTTFAWNNSDIFPIYNRSI